MISFIAIGCSTGITIGILIFSGSIKFILLKSFYQWMIAQQFDGGNWFMLSQFRYSFSNQRQAVMEKLALGATIKLASLPIIQQSVKTGMAPTIDSAKTVGIVSLPGMMSGLIFAGVDPVHAIKYQIMVTFLLLSATSIGSVIATYLAYKGYYNQQKQLVV